MGQKLLEKQGSGFAVGLSRDGALIPGIVADRYQRGMAKGSVHAGHSLVRVKEREVGTDFHCSSESVNRWCTNAMLARLNARDCLQKWGVRIGDLMVSNSLRGAAYQLRGASRPAGCERHGPGKSGDTQNV